MTPPPQPTEILLGLHHARRGHTHNSNNNRKRGAKHSKQAGSRGQNFEFRGLRSSFTRQGIRHRRVFAKSVRCLERERGKGERDRGERAEDDVTLGARRRCGRAARAGAGRRASVAA